MARQWECDYLYTDAEGHNLLRKRRYRVDPPGPDGRSKTFTMQGRPRPRGVFQGPLWRWYAKHPWLQEYWASLLYGLLTLLDVRSDRDAVVVGTEGEKDCETAWSLGYPAVTHWQGAGNFTSGQAAWFKGSRCRYLIVADLDVPGAHCAAKRLDIVPEVGVPRSRIEVVRAAEGKDLTDHVAAGYGIDDLVPVDIARMRALASTYTPALARRAGYRPGDDLPASAFRPTSVRRPR